MTDEPRFDGKAEAIGSTQESTEPVFENDQKRPSRGGNEYIDLDQALGYEMEPVETSYDERDLAIYALGIGAGRDPLAPFDLSLLYEGYAGGFRAFPTYAVIPAMNSIIELTKEGKTAPGMHYGLERMLHGEHHLELRRPLPTRAKLTHHAKLEHIWDKGKDVVLVTSVTSRDEDGDVLAYNEISSFVRGVGGFGGERGPSANVNLPPDRRPDAIVEEATDRNQALLYRQSGDWNPLHADPAFAKLLGFREPILHGLCTFGFSLRHVLRACAPDSNPSYLKSVKVRFADSVFPGETLVTELWRETPTRILFRTRVKERDSVVLSNAAVELFENLPAAKPNRRTDRPTASAASTPGITVEADDVFAVIHGYLVAHPEITKAVGCVYGFKLTNPESSYTVDARGGAGVREGDSQSADCTLELSTEDFLLLIGGEQSAQTLFSSGRLKIAGDMMAAMKLGFLTSLDRSDFQTRAAARGAGRGS